MPNIYTHSMSIEEAVKRHTVAEMVGDIVFEITPSDVAGRVIGTTFVPNLESITSFNEIFYSKR